MIWSQRIDPKAGEWKHEILVRGVLAIVAAGLIHYFLLHVIFTDYFLASPQFLGVDAETLILFAYMGLMLGLAETALRRTWRRLALNIGLFLTAITLVPIITANVELADANNALALAAAIGGAYGICAGLGARNLLATLLGFIGGQCGAIASIKINGAVKLFDFLPSESSFLAMFLIDLVPPALLSGVGVWAGCKFSKTKPTESPQPPAPGGL